MIFYVTCDEEEEAQFIRSRRLSFSAEEKSVKTRLSSSTFITTCNESGDEGKNLSFLSDPSQNVDSRSLLKRS